MKKYEYVRIEGKGTAFSPTVTFDEHRRIIDEYASKGYRYAGYIPAKIQITGCFREIDLIFEKEW